MKRRLSLALLPFLLPLAGYGLTLEEAVQHVNATNPVMSERIQNYNATKHDITKAKSEFLPTADISMYHSHEKTRNHTFTTAERMTRKGKRFQANLNVFNGFGSLANVDQQEARVDAAGQNIQYTSNALSLEMTEAYIELLKQYEFLKIAKKNLKTHNDINSKISTRTESGFGSKSELDQSKSRVALANSNVIIQQSNFRDALTTFERLYGEPVNVDTLVRPDFTYAMPITLESAVQRAKENHPALAVQSSNIKVAEHRLGVAEKEFLPKLDFELYVDDSENVAGWEGEDYTSHAMLTLSYNIFRGNFDRANKEQQQVMILQEKEIKNDIVRRVEENVKFAWIAYEELSKQIPYLKEHRDYSITTLDAYNKEFSLGRRTLLDILNTENELTSAEKELVNAEFDLVLAKYRVLEGIGELSSALDVPSM